MSNINTIAAFFLPKRKFRRAWFPARASLTTGCHRIGCGHLSQLEKRRLDVVEVEADALAEDQTPISLRSRRRMISLIETSSRFASSRSHARSDGSRWMSSRWTLTRFRGLTMPENVHDTRHGVKWQPRRSLVNSRNRYEILGELKVRWRA